MLKQAEGVGGGKKKWRDTAVTPPEQV